MQPQGWTRPGGETRIALGCAAVGCAAVLGLALLICLFVFLDHYGFINDNILKTVRRCRDFGC